MGDYATWAAAGADSDGYDADLILAKTTDALLKVKRGEAVYEQDAVLFDRIDYTWSVLAGLLWAAARAEGTLNVLDFGGSLGSTYFQNRAFLSQLRSVRWNVVEQRKQVAVGQRHFQDGTLHFYASIPECLAATQQRVILLGSVLQYVEQPYALLDELAETPCDSLIVDRTLFWAGAVDRLCVQHVPASIYPASYPCWIFSQTGFLSRLRERWHVVADFTSLDRLANEVSATWQGLIAVRRHASKAV